MTTVVTVTDIYFQLVLAKAELDLKALVLPEYYDFLYVLIKSKAQVHYLHMLY